MLPSVGFVPADAVVEGGVVVVGAHAWGWRAGAGGGGGGGG